METKICSFCGMEYPASEEKCPLCGHSEVVPEEEEPAEPQQPFPTASNARETAPACRRTGARAASGSAIPRWLIALTCVILALALAIFVLFLLAYTGVIGANDPSSNADNSGSVSLPIDEQENPAASKDEEQENQEDQTPTEDGQDNTDETPLTVACTSLTFTSAVYTPSEVGEEYMLSAVVTPADCNEPITFTSSNPAVCSVDDRGTITVLSAGEDVTITAVCGSQTAECLIQVSALEDAPSDPDVEHALSATDITFFTAGESTTLRLSNTTSGDAVVWESEDPSIVEVDENGFVTAVAPGTVDVTATLNGETYTCIVRCNFINSPGSAEDGTAETGRYTISHEDVTLHYLENETFQISLTDYDGTVAWTSSDTDVCTVEDGVVTAVGSGTARVSATVGGTTYSCIVRCIE